LIGAVAAQGQGFFPKLDKGIFNIRDNRLLYVDSGVGTSTMPLRFLNQSDVTLITIEGISSDEQNLVEEEKE
jgi:predicted MPP superfamily phosphohydrolase